MVFVFFPAKKGTVKKNTGKKGDSQKKRVGVNPGAHAYLSTEATYDKIML